MPGGSSVLVTHYAPVQLFAAFSSKMHYSLGRCRMQQGVARTTEPGITRSIQPALSLIEKTPILLETMLRDLPEDLLRWKPSVDRWSIAEVLGHLADIEMVYADRTRRIVAEDTPRLQKRASGATVVASDYPRVPGSKTL